VTERLQIVAGVLQLAGFIPYCRAIVREETKPAKAGWIIWAILDTITFLSMLAAGSLNGLMTASVVGVWVVVALTFRYGQSGFEKLDLICLAGGGLGIALWKWFDNPTYGIVISLIVVLIGAIPTVKNGFKNPQHENITAWAIGWLAVVVALLAVPTWDLDNAMQPLTYFGIQTTMVVLLLKPRIFNPQEKNLPAR
jgi:hypothetical protein